MSSHPPARRRRPSRAARAALGAGLALTALLGAACESGAPQDAAPPSPTRPVPKVSLTFGVYGGEQEVAAFRRLTAEYDAVSRESTVSVVAYPDHDALMAAVRAGDVPDIFLADHEDLPYLREAGVNRPVDEPLDERAVEFGDDYSRDALEAFSADRSLQCMPYGASPEVLFVNTELVDLPALAEKGVDVPEPDATSWSFDQFLAVGRYVRRHHPAAAYVHVPSTLQGLAPWVYSGGGDVYDDLGEPTSLDLSSDSSREALTRTLQVLRNPRFTLSPAQLEERSAVQWFERGRLAVLQGDRSLVPRFRKDLRLFFDVLPVPGSGGSETVGDLTGLCLSADAPSVNMAADFLVHLISVDAVADVVRSGSLVPANQQVAYSQAFLQSGLDPAHAETFVREQRDIVPSPPLLDPEALKAAVDPLLAALVSDPLIGDLEERLAAIDGASRAVLAPEPTGSPSPSESSGDSGSASPSSSASAG